MKKLIFGCGYLGCRVAKLWRQAGHEVLAVTRQAERARRLAEEDLVPLVADISDAVSLAALQEISDIGSVLFAVGYDRASGQSIGDVYVGGLANVLQALPESVGRFIYISSTGVYGDAGGSEVDETSPCEPQREGGKACLAAEQLLQQSRFAGRSIVLRLAGIYGPGRIPRADHLRRGAPFAAPAEGFLNLIHVDDAAEIVLLAERLALPPASYCVSDGQPVVRAEYYRELARLLNAPPPNFVDPAANSAALHRAGSDKRINNARLMRELQPALKYASYREGLAAIVADASA